MSFLLQPPTKPISFMRTTERHIAEMRKKDKEVWVGFITSNAEAESPYINKRTLSTNRDGRDAYYATTKAQ